MVVRDTKKTILSVVIRDRTGVLFEGLVESVSSYNANGLFDILPLHSNFLCIVQRAVLVRKSKKENLVEIPIQQGVLKVRENAVEVYAGI